MLKYPASDAYLLLVFKAGNDSSQAAAIRAIYDLGAVDASRQINGDIAEGPLPKHPNPPPLITIDGPNGPDAPFVETIGGQPPKW